MARLPRLPPFSPRVVARVVAVLLACNLVALATVDEDSRGGGRVAAVGAPVTVADGANPPEVVVEAVPVAAPVVDDTGRGGGVPRLRAPRVPPVTVPSVTVPTVPSITIPPVGNDPARAACVAAAAAPAVNGTVLAEEGTYIADADGTGLRRVARSSDPGTWDTPHRRLAYQAPVDATTHALCVMEGTAIKAVGTVRPMSGFAAPAAMQLWASGDRLAAIDDGGANPALQLFDARNGGKLRDVIGVHPHDVSPDGRKVAFVSGEHPHQVMNLADLDTGAVRQLARLDQDTYTGFYLRWLPDGSGVAYETSGIHVIDVATGARRTLVRDEDEGHSGAYAFAPDGRLAYSTYVGGLDEGRVFVTEADGSNPVQVANGPVSFISWSPTGDRLLLASGVDNEASLQTVRVDGRERRTLFRAAARPGEHWLRFVINNAWSPDGNRIAFGLWRHPAADSVAGPT